MNLHRMLVARAAEGRPLKVGRIGAGKFRREMEETFGR
jgi:predicted homoserine dehydrogenase-like protein